MASTPPSRRRGRFDRSNRRIRGFRMSAIEVKVPDIGDFTDVPVIEVFVRPGDNVKAEDSLVTLEYDKATMDVPAPSAGVVKELKVKLGDKVSEGSVILLLEAAGGTPVTGAKSAPAPLAAAASTTLSPQTTPSPPTPLPQGERGASSAPVGAAPSIDATSFKTAHASPSVRAFARELGVDLARVKGSGPNDRILEADVQKFVKGVMSGAAGAPAMTAAGGDALGLLPWPKVDFTKFGPIESKP